MATSGNTVYSVDRDSIITYAYQLVSAIGEGETPSADKVTDANRALNIMIKAWIAHGLEVWKVQTITIDPLVLDQATYTMGEVGADVTAPRPRRILEAVIRDNTTSEIKDVPLIPLSRNEYWLLSNKQTDGQATQFYFDAQIPLSKFTIWPVADSTRVSDYTIIIKASLPMEDMDTATDEFDFPQEWYEAIAFQLAVRLAPIEGLDLMERSMLKKMADEYLQLVLDFDTEHTSMFIQPSDKLNRGG